MAEVAAFASGGLAVVSMLVFAVASAPKFILRRTGPPPKLIGTFAGLAGLRQGWGLYTGKHESRQVFYAATLRDGSRVDLRHDGDPLDWKRQAARPRSVHWTKAETNLKKQKARPQAERFADYIVRVWDRDHPQNPVADFELVIQGEGPQQAVEVPAPRRARLPARLRSDDAVAAQAASASGR